MDLSIPSRESTSTEQIFQIKKNKVKIPYLRTGRILELWWYGDEIYHECFAKRDEYHSPLMCKRNTIFESPFFFNPFLLFFE